MMNLRLDEQSARIRISYQEAKDLLEARAIEQGLSLFSGRLKIELATGEDSTPLILEIYGPRDIQVKVAARDIQKILRALDAGEKKSENLEINTVYKGVGINSMPIQVSFEIDRFKGPRH